MGKPEGHAEDGVVADERGADEEERAARPGGRAARSAQATTRDEELLARNAVQALRSAAAELGVEPLALARRLQDGEVARLMQLLNAALPHVATAGLRHRIEDLLTAATDGRMPMFEKPETELDFAMQTLRQRRKARSDDDAASGAEPDDGPPRKEE